MDKELEQKALDIEQKKREDELLRIYDGEDRIITSLELKEKIENQPKNVFKLTTNIPSLNEMFDGFREGNIISVSGHSGDGKTQFCVGLTEHFSSIDVNSLWLEFEIGEEEFLERFGDKIPLFCVPNNFKESSLSWLRNRIKEAIIKHNIKVIFIDHLHFMLGMKEDDIINKIPNHTMDSTLSSYLGMLMRELKRIARQNKLIIFLIVHPRKADETQALTMSEIGKDSVSITQDSDIVMSIRQERIREGRSGAISKTGKTILSIHKNRRKGFTRDIVLIFNNGKYLEMAKNYD